MFAVGRVWLSKVGVFFSPGLNALRLLDGREDLKLECELNRYDV